MTGCLSPCRACAAGMRRSAVTAAELRYLSRLWPALHATRMPGTRPWRPPVWIDPEQAATRDQQAHLDRLYRDPDAPGSSAAPLDLAALDLLRDLALDVAQLAEIVSMTARCPLPAIACDLRAGAVGALRHAAACLPTAWDANPDVGRWAELETRRIIRRVDRHLGQLRDGQRLSAICPWCGGGVRREPTWRVRILPGDQPAIVCESELCEPPSKDVGTWWLGRPAWPMPEWDWLARRIAAAEQRAG